MDPYRGSTQVGTCPRCGNSTEADGVMGRLVCMRGCGEWYPREMLKDHWPIVTQSSRVEAQPRPFTPAKCPMCSGDMKVGPAQRKPAPGFDASGAFAGVRVTESAHPD